MKRSAVVTSATAFTAAALGAATLALSSPALACGGFFCSQAQPVNQAAERIIFADNGNGTVTAVIQILYQGPSENFSWLLPIASVPEGNDIGVGSDLAFSRLQAATNPQFNLTTRVEGTCGGRDDSLNVPSAAAADGDNAEEGDAPGGNVTLEASGVVGAFEYAVISVEPGTADPAGPAAQWLTENGYDIPPGGNELLGPYLADGMYLLALRLTKGSDVGSIRPIVLTYSASAPMIPIKLTAVAANQDMGVMAWVLSSARSVPFNYNALELNEARINWFNASSNYEQVINEAADEAGGRGFVTEFAGPSSQLADVVWSAAEESRWRSLQQATGSRSNQFDDLWALLGSASGFWDAVREHVQLPPEPSLEEFQACPPCYADGVVFTPSELLPALERDVVEPLRQTQALIDGAPYATRLYSTLSASEMTVDPAFVVNPELPDVNNIHQATRVIECHRGVSPSEANWRIELPQGTTIRGTGTSVGQWPAALNAQPPNQRILALSASGEGMVLADNNARIASMSADYNASVPTTHSDSGCSLSAAPTGPSRLSFAAALALGVALLSRRQRRSAAARAPASKLASEQARRAER